MKVQPRPTQRDIAQATGLSQALVSLVLRGDSNHSIPDKTRQRVIRAARRLGYVANRAARSLRTQRTYTIAVVIRDITNPFYPQFVRGIQDVAEAHHIDVTTYNTDDDHEKELRSVDRINESRPDGLIIVPFSLTGQDLSAVARSGTAIAVVASPQLLTRRRPPIDCIDIDNTSAARTAVTHLLELGHTRVAMISGQSGGRLPDQRRAGYLNALLAQGVRSDPKLIRTGDFSVEGGYKAMCELIDLRPRPTAVFAANDLMAMGALRAARDAGVQVPHDISIVGFDDVVYSRLLNPSLTSVAQFPDRIGAKAAELVLERISAPDLEARVVELPYELIVRESSGSARSTTMARTSIGSSARATKRHGRRATAQ